MPPQHSNHNSFEVGALSGGKNAEAGEKQLRQSGNGRLRFKLLLFRSKAESSNMLESFIRKEVLSGLKNQEKQSLNGLVLVRRKSSYELMYCHVIFTILYLHAVNQP